MLYLCTIVAGSRQAYENALSVIEKLGRPYYIGGKDGAANVIKLALNLNIGLIASAVSEGITLARGSGIDPLIFIQILNSTYFKTGLSEKKGQTSLRYLRRCQTWGAWAGWCRHSCRST